MAEVAVLGTGRMGAAMTRRLAGAGHDVSVWNRTPERAEELAAEVAGLRASATAAEAVAGRDVVISVLATGGATLDVLTAPDVMEAVGRAVVVDHATTGPAIAREAAAALAAAGRAYLDAPVSGSVATVGAGRLLVLAAGDTQAIERAEPVLAAYARRVVHVGEPGTAQVLKLAVNGVVHTTSAAVSEALVLAAAGGVPMETAYGVLEDSVVSSPFLQYKRAAFLAADAPVAMSIDLTVKDLGLIAALGAELGVDLGVVTAVREAYRSAGAAGLGDADMAALAVHLRRGSHGDGPSVTTQ